MYASVVLKPIWPYVEYFSNQDYIASVLCENKDKPWVSCNGKCYLTKQIKKVTDLPEPKLPSQPSVDSNKEEVYLSVNHSFSTKLFDSKRKSFTVVFNGALLQRSIVPTVPPPEALS